MTWILKYRCRAFLRSSLYAAPIASMALALLVAPLIRSLDNRTQWTLLNFGTEGARAVAGVLAGSLLTFIVFSFSIILLAVQVAGSQLSPRVIARIFETNLVKAVLSTFVFTFLYTLAALGRIEERVPQLPILVAVVASMVSIILFLYLIQKGGADLRQGVVLTQVARATRSVIEAHYPNPLSTREVVLPQQAVNSLSPTRTVVHREASGAFLAFDADGLVEIATRAGCVIELVPQVGDLLATGEDAFRLYGAGSDAVEDGRLHACIALGTERTLQQDPAFGIRIIVDIAIKALSPAINDPTTGVLALDQIQHLLHLLSLRQLGSGIVRDASGAVRLVYRTPCWEDFVTLSVTEIRMCGAGSPQVTRRLQAMYQHLAEEVPAERSAAIRTEMALLARTIERTYTDPEDRILAGVGDLQGFGSREHKYDPERVHAGLSVQKTKETPL